ncbi:DUF2335 domain-containing protein [Salmonella enterica]|nr:DUF2335 domain-containing protein [Salmonella enterica]ECH8186076.1 DUF2335 domain-containing protein [Salmonella enterica subsp. enterica serovar Rissen]EDM2047193.1 DUF2335 domain-containing protein [Salmonella enterica subsp. enterica serovar Muenchen]EEJ6876454.1 DUF2335 domain-containing protein [Salmonella enterica subsp. houtenae]EBJ7262035.1 DUF2335 domain-containing protein [Salmonella enterica]
MQPDTPQENNDHFPDNNDERTYLASLSLSMSPLPPPEVLREYERLAPGSVEILINMAAQEQKHRHRLDLVPVELKAKEKRRGQWMGFILALSVLVLAVWMVLEGYAGMATTLVSSVFVAIAAVFVIERHPGSRK